MLFVKLQSFIIVCVMKGGPEPMANEPSVGLMKVLCSLPNWTSGNLSSLIFWIKAKKYLDYYISLTSRCWRRHCLERCPAYVWNEWQVIFAKWEIYVQGLSERVLDIMGLVCGDILNAKRLFMSQWEIRQSSYGDDVVIPWEILLMTQHFVNTCVTGEFTFGCFKLMCW